jgi:hypothetical protein
VGNCYCTYSTKERRAYYAESTCDLKRQNMFPSADNCQLYATSALYLSQKLDSIEEVAVPSRGKGGGALYDTV